MSLTPEDQRSWYAILKVEGDRNLYESEGAHDDGKLRGPNATTRYSFAADEIISCPAEIDPPRNGGSVPVRVYNWPGLTGEGMAPSAVDLCGEDITSDSKAILDAAEDQPTLVK